MSEQIKAGDWMTDGRKVKYKVIGIYSDGSCDAKGDDNSFLEISSIGKHWTKCKPPRSHYPYILVVAAFIIGLVYFNWGR